jgi:hypothetical protein
MFNHLKDLIENPHQPPRLQNTSQYSSLTNSMSPAAMSTPPSYLSAPQATGYKIPPAINNFRSGGVAGYHGKLDIGRVVVPF